MGDLVRVGSKLGLATLVVACSSGSVGSSPPPDLGTAGTLASTSDESSSGDDDEDEGSSSGPGESSGPSAPGCMDDTVDSGELCYGEFIYFNEIPGASWIAATSFDGDPALDLAVVAQTQGAVYVLFGQGNGNFMFDAFYNVGSGAAVVASGSFDDWALPDLVTANAGADSLSILLNTGTGEFGSATSVPVYADPLLLAVDDFNGDGFSDVAVAHQDDTAQLTIMLGGAGSLTQAAVLTLTGGDALGLDAADVDGDTFVDLVAGIENADEVAILSGDGLGAFTETARFSAGGEHAIAVRATDLDGDGGLEIVVGNRFPSDLDAGNMQIVDHDGAGWVSAQLVLTEGAGAVDFGDFDADGDEDIVLSTLEGGSLQLFMNEGGAFGAVETFTLATPAEPFGVIARDFDNDGAVDLATADRLGNRLAVLMAEP